MDDFTAAVQIDSLRSRLEAAQRERDSLQAQLEALKQDVREADAELKAERARAKRYRTALETAADTLASFLVDETRAALSEPSPGKGER